MKTNSKLKPSASVVIPSWNGKHLLKACLSSLEKQTLKKIEVIIVDNGSKDGSVEYIKRYFSQFKVVELDRNYGFARAVNVGIKQAKADYIVLINNDTEVDKYCLQYLVKAADKHKDVGFIAAKILNFYKRKLIDSAGDYIDVVGHANNIGLGEKDGEKFNKEGYVFLVTGGGGLFKREVFKRVGLFDEDYFAYFEDVDLCLRAQLQGFKGWFEPKAKIYHIHKATSSNFREFTEYLHLRNLTQTIIKDFPTGLLKHDYNWLRIILVNASTVRHFWLQGLLWQALKAEFYILTHLPQLLSKRRTIQKTKKVPDHYIIDNFLPKKITFFGLFKRGI